LSFSCSSFICGFNHVQRECPSKVRMARHSARGLRGDLGADPLKNRRGFYILELDANPCIIVLVVIISSAIFLNLKHFMI
jgi:hypothetical protein